MKRKRFSDEQIIGILKEADAGTVVLDLCRKHGMSSATFYAWKSKYGGLEQTPAVHAAGLILAAARPVDSVAEDGDNNDRPLVAAG